MRTLIINVDDVKSEKALLDYLDSIGLDYSIDLNDKTFAWWEDQQTLTTINNRSNNLKNGTDKGLSFSDIKEHILRK